MSITYIKIENFKSIKKIYLDFCCINALIGANGSGKSNIISALKFFFENIKKTDGMAKDEQFDSNNKYSNEIRITVKFDIKNIVKRCRENKRKDPNSKYIDFYESVISLSENYEVELTLIAIKGKKIVWNKGYKERKLLFDLHPVYFIDTRNINLTDWENLWLQIGDLSKLDDVTGNDVYEQICGVLKQHTRVSNYYNRIQDLFNINKIQVKKYTPKEMATALAKCFFYGNEFQVKDNHLSFYSNGTNTYTYIIVVIGLLGMLSGTKMKEPMLILDEPELSLHHDLIDMLMENILAEIKSVKCILSTHSARIIKNILIYSTLENNIGLFHVNSRQKYTCICRMKALKDNRERVAITEQHANSYFAKMLVCVEGRTELELLQTPFLRLIYPILKKVDVVEGMAQEVDRKIIAPDVRGYVIPILYTIDMDKVLQYEFEKERFKLTLNKDFNQLDAYSFTYKRRDTVTVCKRIKAMAEKCAFHYKEPFYSSDDENYNILKRIIKEYYLEHNYFVMDTTIEGLLINEKNVNMFEEFLMVDRPDSKHREEIKSLIATYSLREKTNLYRIMCEGKSDFLLKQNKISELIVKNKDNASVPDKKLAQKLSKSFYNKTEGWVNRWIKFIVCNISGVDRREKDCFEKVKRKIDEDKQEKIRKMFSTYFPELNIWINEIKRRLWED